MSSAETLTVRLVRPDTGVSWGFRLQGGADFNTPLSIQSVTQNGVAERSGLRAGDGVLYINNVVSDSLSHDEAKGEILRSGNDISLTVVRGAVSTWKPKVTPISDLRPDQLRTVQLATGDEIQTSQKTSLEREQPESQRIGGGYNRTAKPFLQQPPKQATPNIVHAQFNSPIGLYSASNLAETYRMQTEGIQKEMENLDIAQSPVGTKMTGTFQVVEDPNVSGFRSVRAPETKPMSQQRQQSQGSMHCGLCGNLVTGVFVKAKDIPYHAQCFKCTSCGVNLKQKGYFVIEGQLYCEIHAKQKAAPPDPNMKAVPVYR